MTASMNVEFALDPTETSEDVAQDYSFISSMETMSGKVRFRCNSDKPTHAIKVVLKGI